MKTINKFAVALLSCVFACGCSTTNDNIEDEPAIVLSTIAGHWNVTAYQDGNHFIPATNPEYYEFTPSGEFAHVYEHTADLIDTTTGSYTYDPDKKTIHVEEPRGWNLDIAVQFLSTSSGDYQAIFDIKGRTPAQSKIVRVQRQE